MATLSRLRPYSSRWRTKRSVAASIERDAQLHGSRDRLRLPDDDLPPHLFGWSGLEKMDETWLWQIWQRPRICSRMDGQGCHFRLDPPTNCAMAVVLGLVPAMFVVAVVVWNGEDLSHLTTGLQ